MHPRTFIRDCHPESIMKRNRRKKFYEEGEIISERKKLS